MDPKQTERKAPLTAAERAEAIGPHTMGHLSEAPEADIQRNLMHLSMAHDAEGLCDIVLSITVKFLNDSETSGA